MKFYVDVKQSGDKVKVKVDDQFNLLSPEAQEEVITTLTLCQNGVA